MRTLVGNGVKVRFAFFQGSLRVTPTDTVTVTVTRANGEVLPALTAVSADDEAYDSHVEVELGGVYTERLDTLTLTWSTTIDGMVHNVPTKVDVVGARYFDLHELRAMDGLTSHNNYSDQALDFAREVAEARIENYTKASFVPQHRYETHDAASFWRHPYGCLYTRRAPVRRLVSVNLYGVDQDITDWAVTSTGELRAGAIDTATAAVTRTDQDLIIGYEYGEDLPSQDLKRGALRYARRLALTELSTLPENTRMLQTDMGIAVLNTASEMTPTGIPDVDTILVELRKTTAASFA